MASSNLQPIGVLSQLAGSLPVVDPSTLESIESLQDQTASSSISITLLALQKKLFLNRPEFEQYAIKELKYAAKMLVKNTTDILEDIIINPFNEVYYEERFGKILYSLCLGFSALEREVPEASELWGESSVPNLDMIRAKLIRYSSNVYAVAHGYPDTALESNMDYDLRQYLMFFFAYLKEQGIDMQEYVQHMFIQLELSLV